MVAELVESFADQLEYKLRNIRVDPENDGLRIWLQGMAVVVPKASDV
jgi:hypothetical protein